MYFVFFWSSCDPTGLVTAATSADAEFEFVCDGVDASAVAVCRFVLLIVTVVQSWQSGACRSGVLYLFFVDIGILYSLFVNQCLYSLFIFISNNLFE
jgi:hypothetical protein